MTVDPSDVPSGYEPCPTCNGTGNNRGVPFSETSLRNEDSMAPCPTCGGIPVVKA